eukprot:TRINITY_DN14663_c0_g1_i1.p1 TRINITY_DN14663_c0_g1~~TRINITY_DN14663_c0_g1_i1.p1  ORF type:complete len:703 (+),score=92.29 TRINITY_DN14663_c0_g1_i1:36-2144(+)
MVPRSTSKFSISKSMSSAAQGTKSHNRDSAVEQAAKLRLGLTRPAPIQYDDANWHPWQKLLDRAFQGNKYEVVMGSLIVFNLIIMVIEIDIDAGCLGEAGSCANTLTEVTDACLVAVFTIDLVLKVFAYRLQFHQSMWNILDATIVTASYVGIVMAAAVGGRESQVLSTLRLLRLVRILRLVRLLRPIPELYRLLLGFMSTVRAIFWGFMLILVLLLGWGMLTVQVVQPFRDKQGTDWCDDAFSSVFKAMLYHFQTLIAGDSWGTCAVPLVNEEPAMVVVFAGALVCIQLGFTNLVLSVIVDSAAQARDEDVKVQEMAQRVEGELRINEFYNIMRSLDGDDSGYLTYDEVSKGWHECDQFRESLKQVGIDAKSLKKLWSDMDSDGSGTVSYIEFVEAMLNATTSDQKIDALMIKLQLDSMSRQIEAILQHVQHVESEVEHFDEDILDNAKPRISTAKGNAARQQKSSYQAQRGDPGFEPAKQFDPKGDGIVTQAELTKNEELIETGDGLALTATGQGARIDTSADKFLDSMSEHFVTAEERLQELSRSAEAHAAALVSESGHISRLLKSAEIANARSEQIMWNSELWTPPGKFSVVLESAMVSLRELELSLSTALSSQVVEPHSQSTWKDQFSRLALLLREVHSSLSSSSSKDTVEEDALQAAMHQVEKALEDGSQRDFHQLMRQYLDRGQTSEGKVTGSAR